MRILETLHSLANILIERVRGELVKHGVRHGHPFNVVLDIEEGKTAVAYKQDFRSAFKCFIQMTDSLVDGLHGGLLG